MKQTGRIVKPLLLMAVAISLTACPPTALSVRRFNTAAITNAQADQAFGDKGAVLILNDGPGDVACGVSFERTGNVTSFATGDGAIDSSAEFNAVIGLNGNVKVVNAINFCSSFAPNIIGCAPRPGTSYAVVRVAQNVEGLLWAHEYGHNKGLRHRNNVNAVMNPTITTSSRRVNQAECNAFEN